MKKFLQAMIEERISGEIRNIQEILIDQDFTDESSVWFTAVFADGTERSGQMDTSGRIYW